MSDENQTSGGSITSIEVVAVRIVRETPEPAHAVSAHTIDGSLDLTAARLVETGRPPQLIVSQAEEGPSVGARQIGATTGQASPAWTGELEAPHQHEAVSSVIRRDRGGLRIGLLTGMMAGALGIGWWTGLLDPWLNSNLMSTPPQQVALAERAVPDIDKPPTSEPAAKELSTAVESGKSSAPADSGIISTLADNSSVSAPAESSTKAIDGPAAPPGDQGVVTPAGAAPMTTQKTAAVKPIVTPPKPQEKHGQNRPRPVPETRPTTMAGWTIRSVSGGTAVLQGPDGIRKVSVGETVPGAGRIDSIVRWGNRWIVATSKGLISTD